MNWDWKEYLKTHNEYTRTKNTIKEWKNVRCDTITHFDLTSRTLEGVNLAFLVKDACQEKKRQSMAIWIGGGSSKIIGQALTDWRKAAQWHSHEWLPQPIISEPYSWPRPHIIKSTPAWWRWCLEFALRRRKGITTVSTSQLSGPTKTDSSTTTYT